MLTTQLIFGLLLLLLQFRRLVRDDACYPREGRGRLEGWCCKVAIAINLYHEDAQFERAVDLAVLQQVATDDALGGLKGATSSTSAARAGQRHLSLVVRRADIRAVVSGASCSPGGRVAVAQVASRERLALGDVLAQVELDDAEREFVARRKLLDHLKLDRAVCQVVALIDANTNVLYVLAETIVDVMAHNGTFRRAAAVLGVNRVHQVPFDG